jgi:hypothetical protein
VKLGWLVDFMVFSAFFNNISAISWWSVLLVEETGGHGEDHRPATGNGLTLSHNVVHLTTSVVIGTDCIDSFKPLDVKQSLMYQYSRILHLHMDLYLIFNTVAPLGMMTG